ncbi:MAG TPA: sirohydrochlorin chelatase [Actinomycetota bacterium]|jgi:sirohydrochlorin cobaltochelatase
MSPALLVAGHGSRDPAAVGEFWALVHLVRRRVAGLAVAGGFIELARPSLASAAASLVKGGADDVVVVPLMLLAAGHTKNDVPASIAAARLAHPDVRFRYGRDLGIDPRLLGIVDERIAAVVAPWERAETAVLLVGRGSSDPDANADLCKVARLVHEGRPFPMVEPAFSGITTPRVPEGLARCVALGARRIVAVPYFLFTGVLVQRIARDCAELERAHPGVEVRVARHLGPVDAIAELVVERYEEVLGGSPRMNCDLCIHRIALPGFEHRVEAPAMPHHHPDHDDAHAHAPDPGRAHGRARTG